MLGPKKSFGSHKIWLPENFGQEKIGPWKFRFPRIFGSEIFLVPKKIGSQKFLGRKIFATKDFTSLKF